MGKELNCIENFKKCLALNVNHYGASLQLANLLVMKGKGESAAEYFVNAARIDPNKAEPQFGLMLAVKRYS
jgi:Tfp pilus assembly protein PilF